MICRHYKPIYRSRSKRSRTMERHSGGHSKIGKRQRVIIGYKFILGSNRAQFHDDNTCRKGGDT